MTDQSQRLEVATVKAEVGSNILYRFANDPAANAEIPTEAGDIPNLKQVILQLQEEGAEKISFATTIYPTTAAGIAATASGAVFLVVSNEADEIYAVYTNTAGVAVDTGKRALSSQAVENAMQAATEAADAAQEAADLSTERTARFLASVSTPPVIRDDGTPLQLGDRYVNTDNQAEYIYKSSGWVVNDSLEAIAEIQDSTDPAKGAAKVGWDGETVGAQLDQSKSLPDYASLRAYTGSAFGISITGPGISGNFRRLGGTQADDGLVFFRDGLGRTWERQYTGDIDLSWSGARGDAGTTDNYVAILAAIAAVPAGSGLAVRRGPWGGSYANKTAALTLPAGLRITYERGARFTSSGAGSYVHNADVYALGAGHGPAEYRNDTLTRGLLVELNTPIAGPGATSTYQFNRVFIAGDTVDAENDGVAGSKVDGFYIAHHFGGAGCRGGRHAFESALYQDAPTELDGIDQNYCAGVSAIYGTGDGGTDVNLRGSYFAQNFYASLKGAMYTKHLNGCESNTFMDAGSSTLYRTGYSSVCGGVGQGTLYDAAFSIGALGVGDTSQWRDGLLAGPQNGRQPLTRSIVRNQCSVQNIISTDRDTAPLLNSDTGLWKLSSAGYEAYFPNHAIQIGSKTVVNTPVQLFYTGSTFYAGRLVATGGAVASNGAGVLAIQFDQTTARQIVPDGNNTRSLGTSALQWSEVLAVKGTFSGPVRVGQYTISTMPSAAAYAGYEIDVTDAPGGSKRCRSNGTNWLILNTSTIVS